MKSPFTGKEMSIVKEKRSMNFRKDEFNVLFHSYKCEDTEEQFEDDVFANINYNQLVNQYRMKYIIPFPEQIIAIRTKYNLSATKMSEILGFGINSYRQYENGEVPNHSNAKLIQLAEDPHEFKKLVALSGLLDKKFAQKINKRIEALIEEQKLRKSEAQLEDYFFGNELPNSYTGYKTPSFLKFSEMVVFFAESIQPWKTKMNKLLFYADFMMYQKTGFSISGVKYRAIPMGPVPNNFNSIFEYLATNDEIDIYYTTYSEGFPGEQFKPNKNKQFNSELFNDEELAVLREVIKKFRKTSTKKIIEISHAEKAWKENEKERNFIDYNYSFELN